MRVAMLRSRRIGAMRDIELYRALLGLTAPWPVPGGDVDMKGHRVVVLVEAESGPYPCPECGRPGPRYEFIVSIEPLSAGYLAARAILVTHISSKSLCIFS